MKIYRHHWKDHIAVLPLSFELTVALIFTPVRNLFPLESTLVQFTRNIKGPLTHSAKAGVTGYNPL